MLGLTQEGLGHSSDRKQGDQMALELRVVSFNLLGLIKRAPQ